MKRLLLASTSRLFPCIFLVLIFCVTSLLLLADKFSWTRFGPVLTAISSRKKIILSSLPWRKNESSPLLITDEKRTTKWIVITSIQSPTEDVKHLASLPEWTVVVVGDGKTPSDWKLDDVHFLSIVDQHRLGLDSVNALPLSSYTRKNAGYLYAIANGAEWIYDTDDDNKPYGKGLDQFDFVDTVSGIRFQDVDSEEDSLTQNRTNTSSSAFKQRLFNPYRHFGAADMWPRGFPLEYYSNHSHSVGMFRVCKRMQSAAVQQGIVHKDPDVDAIYRLLKANPTDGLNVRFNKFAPPVTLASGTFSPWNSQNTLFHRRAFFGLFLPTTVSFRVTDIWRSFFTQKLLHLIGESVSFVPVNAIQIRNAHDFLKDFKQEIDVYEKTGELLLFLDMWKCPLSSTDACAIQLAADMAARQFWGKEDARLVRLWIEDLKKIGYKFPSLRDGRSDYPIDKSNLTDLHNCRPMHIELTIDLPEDLSQPILKRAEEKIAAFGDLEKWCHDSPETANLTLDFPAPAVVAELHAATPAFQEKLDTVLVLTHNYGWRYGVGFHQRLYDGFFAAVFFCGTFDPNEVDKDVDANYPPMKSPVNYVYLSQEEMNKGYRAYYCLAKINELRLQNVKGYFLVSDDAVFNLWHPLDLSLVQHSAERTYQTGSWWDVPGLGLESAKKAVELIKGKYAGDQEVQTAWRQYKEALATLDYHDLAGRAVRNASEQLITEDGHAISDWHFMPSTNLTFFAALANVFYEANFFHELAFNKFLYTLPHKEHPSVFYLWHNRDQWAEQYNSSLLALHPVKTSLFKDPSAPSRPSFCRNILSVMHANIFHPKRIAQTTAS